MARTRVLGCGVSHRCLPQSRQHPVQTTVNRLSGLKPTKASLYSPFWKGENEREKEEGRKKRAKERQRRKKLRFYFYRYHWRFCVIMEWNIFLINIWFYWHILYLLKLALPHFPNHISCHFLLLFLISFSSSPPPHLPIFWVHRPQATKESMLFPSFSPQLFLSIAFLHYL